MIYALKSTSIYFIAQQSLKSFDRPLMRVSLPDSILVIFILY